MKHRFAACLSLLHNWSNFYALLRMNRKKFCDHCSGDKNSDIAPDLRAERKLAKNCSSTFQCAILGISLEIANSWKIFRASSRFTWFLIAWLRDSNATLQSIWFRWCHYYIWGFFAFSLFRTAWKLHCDSLRNQLNFTREWHNSDNNVINGTLAESIAQSIRSWWRDKCDKCCGTWSL